MFFVIIYSAIDQGYIGLSLASCHKDEIWDLRAELGLIWDHFRALVPIGTKSQIWDIITSTVLVIWIFSFPRPNFPKPRPRLFSETNFFQNPNRNFFSETKFSETETFFRDQIFWNRNFFLSSSFPKLIQKPSEKNWQVSKPRSFDTKMSHSCRGAILSINHKFQGFWRGDANRSYRAPTLSILWKQLPWYWPRYVIQFR